MRHETPENILPRLDEFLREWLPERPQTVAREVLLPTKRGLPVPNPIAKPGDF